MSDPRFGRSTVGLLRHLRPVRIDPGQLRDVADAVLPALSTADVRASVVDRRATGSVLVVEEDERRVQVPLVDLAEDMATAGVPASREGLAAALSAWVAHRPVTDAAAASEGVAVLDWADRTRTAVGWRVVVRRGDVALPWRPSTRVDAAAVHRTRSAALGRAHAVPVDVRVEGPVALWSHPGAPALATSALVDPDRMLRRIAEAGLVLREVHVVVTPHRPVACAEPPVAGRLARETGESCVTLPRRMLPDLPWTP